MYLPDRLSEAIFDAASVQLATIVSLSDEGEPQVQLDPTQPAITRAPGRGRDT